MIKSVQRLIAVDPGLNARHVLLMDMALPQTEYVRPAAPDDVLRRRAARGRIVAGRRDRGRHQPPAASSGANAGRGFVIEGRPAPPPNEGLGAHYRLTCPGYFATLGIPIVRGRDFTRADTTTRRASSSSTSRRRAQYWPDDDPIGQRMKLGRPRLDEPVDDHRRRGARRPALRARRRRQPRDLSSLQPGGLAVDDDHGEDRDRAAGARTRRPGGARAHRLRAAGVARPDDGAGRRGVDRRPPLSDAAARACSPAWRSRSPRSASTASSATSSRSGRARSASAWRSARAAAR